jgi:hypothetical protein
VISTLSMDILSVIATRLRLTAPLPPQLIGRWFGSVARVQPFHADIARFPPVRHEIAIALPVHYAIGATLAALYLWAAYHIGWPARSLTLALAFGLCTNVLPWLVMFPPGYLDRRSSDPLLSESPLRRPPRARGRGGGGQGVARHGSHRARSPSVLTEFGWCGAAAGRRPEAGRRHAPLKDALADLALHGA